MATSGRPVSFSISALDESSNPTNAVERIWFMSLQNFSSPETTSETPFSSVLIPVLFVASDASHYNQIFVTAGGRYQINVHLVDRRGYNVDCYLNLYFDGAPVLSSFQPEASLPPKAHSVLAVAFTSRLICPSETVAIKAFGSVHLRLHIYGQLVMDERCSSSGCAGHWTPSLEGLVVSFMLKVSSSVDIEAFYFKISTPSQLQVNSMMLASFSSVKHTAPLIIVQPARACAPLSLLSGSGLLFATAGQQSSF